ncbi:RecA-superfamily ATPase [Ferroplasma acidiphilum]|uniref:RecA-superfamily ATPase n=2 Tax=Ferroplasma acidiphilum TaxID=74969 RepID=A0A1V0N493_9ARCH|nr:RecA-superfamily ATPase [Ferroplasma acidiphilum]
MAVQGASGLSYKFDYIIASGEDKIAVKLANSDITTNDIMVFNSQATDAGIARKILISEIELGEYVKKMCNIYGIIISDPREIATPDAFRARFGIPILDAKLSGGLRPGYVYMISGKPGVGKTTLSSTFLSYGASIGEKGLMILTDTFPDQFIDNIRTMNIGFAEAYKDRKIEVMEISDQIRSMKSDISQGKADSRKFITKLVTELKKIIISKDIKRVVIDPITLLIIPDDDFVNLLLNSMAIKGVTILITSGLRNSNLSIFGIEEYYTTGIIKLEYRPQNDISTRTGSIIKMRGTAFDPNPFDFKITADGIVPLSNLKMPEPEATKSNREAIEGNSPENPSSDDSLFRSIR